MLFFHLKGLGWGMVVVSGFVAIYYNIISAWSIFYIAASFTSELPWTYCDNEFNTPGMDVTQFL